MGVKSNSPGLPPADTLFGHYPLTACLKTLVAIMFLNPRVTIQETKRCPVPPPQKQ
jgi:hypothetical protein